MEGEDRGRQQVVVVHKATVLAAPMGDRGTARATVARGVIREECAFVKM